MKRKIFVIVVTLLMCISATVIIPSEFEVEANPGGGEGGEDDGITLDYDYIWNRTIELVEVIYEYPQGLIPKGRSFGSWGSNYAVTDILIPKMNAIDLENVDTETIGDLDNTDKDYTSVLNVSDFKLTVNNGNFPFNNDISEKERFLIPAARNQKCILGSWTFNHTFNNVEILPVNMTSALPLSGSITDHFNITSDNYDDHNNFGPLIFGNLSYINGTVPDVDNQTDMIFILDDASGAQDKMDNITNASGCIIVDFGTKGLINVDPTQCSSFPVVSINESNGLMIKQILENYSLVIVDNITGNLTVNYDYGNCSLLPSSDYIIIDCIPDHYEIHNETTDLMELVKELLDPEREEFNIGDYLLCWKLHTQAYWLINQAREFLGKSLCKGFILYDSFETHFMLATVFNWANRDFKPEDLFGMNQPRIPTFTLNKTVGSFLVNNCSTTTISGYGDQEFLQEPNEGSAIDAYNVFGNITIDESPDDTIAIISNRYDGWWGQTPGDSGVGGAIVLGIAKYMTEHNITPKYNLTFLFTTGEEYGFRGAWHYNDNRPYEDTPKYKNNIKYWFILDQLAFDQADTELCFYFKNGNHQEIVDEIMKNQTQYWKRSGYDNLTFNDNGAGSEQKIASSRENCDSFCFVKDENYQWDRWHRTGMNYTEGDSLNYIDQNDVNITAELVWNVTKYFLVNPDCWFDSHNWNVSDSDDQDKLNDTVTINIDVKSVLPDDLVMVNFTLLRMVPNWYISNSSINNFVMSKYLNFSVNRSTTSKSINITLPENEPPGFFLYKIGLYNSTGRINEIVGLSGENINQTEYSGFFFLHPYNYSAIPPEITNVTDSPDPVGYGFNVTISADVTSNVTSIDMVTVNISYPDDTLKSYNMSNTVGDTYEFVFNDTWQHGQYDYVIWVKDIYGVENGSSQYSFNVSVNATISVCTVKDSYGDGEIVNLTDPPGDIGSMQQIGYELLDNGEVLRVWNTFDNYYFNTSNGIQLTNHYNEFWSHNVLMLGYYNNDEWNLIYRTDELSGFNQDIESDNETFVNVTLWKDLTYGGYDFRLAIRYYLGVDDNELTVIPYIKNIDDEDIPWVLGFAWEIKDIQIGMTTSGDYIEINGTTYFLNEEDLDETYTNLNIPCFCIREDLGGDESESLYLGWDENLNYVVSVKSKDGQYNAPVTLGIKIGTLDVGQEKYTSLFWHDALEKVYYFDSYESGGPKEWPTNPAYMVDGNISTYASTAINLDLERCNNDTCDGTDLGTITKVEIRCYGYHAVGWCQADIILRPIFDAMPGDDHTYVTSISGDWSQWFEITDDTNAPAGWRWSDVEDLFCDVIAQKDPMGPPTFMLYCSKVEVRVTYNVGPVVSDPYPANGSTGVSIAPVLSVNVYDADNDLMNISWLSNSSGSWQVFGSNSSVQTGTYYQTMSNANVNGEWWYWRVNVSDGTNYTLSDVFRFYTGDKSMIENTGSTNFSGYLLMRIDYYNTSSSSWVVEQVVVNETTPRVINVDGVLGLDTIFNAHSINTSSFQNGNGTYCVYACLRDPDGNVLYSESGGSSMGGGSLAAVYVFTVTFD